MRRIFLLVVMLGLLILFSSKTTSVAAVERFSTCDLCGLCPNIDVTNGTCTIAPGQVPGDWRRCAPCLYNVTPPAVGDLPNCDTLSIKPDGTPLKPARKGMQFTLLGCITSGASSGFDDQQRVGQGSYRGAPTVVQALLNVIFSLAGGIALLYLMYGAFIVLTSQADPERLNYGRRLIYGAIVGLIITIASVFVVNFVASGILRIPGFTGAV